jgi:hypothetical protein
MDNGELFLEGRRYAPFLSFSLRYEVI